ncbi:MAG: PAS domain-containing protein [Chloroflexi bacterium]|nr:PAS domain-containing protein [Chloroflexota bacterium]
MPGRKQQSDRSELVSLSRAAQRTGISRARLTQAVKTGILRPAGRSVRGRDLYSLQSVLVLSESPRKAEVFAALKGDPDLPPGVTEADRALASLPYLTRILVNADYAAITVINAEGKIERMFVSGLSQEVVAKMGPPPTGKGILGLMGTETTAVRVGRISSHPRSVGFPPGHPQMESLLGVAVQRDGVHLANLYLTNRPGRPPFTVDDQKLVETVAQYVAAALENRRLYAREQRLRHEAEAARRRLEAFAAATPAGVVAIDAATDEIILVNEEVSKLFGVPVDRGMKRASIHPHFVYRHPDGSVIAPEELPIYRAMRTGEIVRGEEIIFERSRNRKTPLLIHAAPVTDEDGKVIAGIAIFQDITPLKAAEQVKSDFLSMITHDLRTPLATLKGLAAEAAASAGDTAELKETLQAMDEEADQMIELVGNLLDMSRIEAGAYPLGREECHLADIAHDALRRLRRSRLASDRDVRSHVPITLSTIYADPLQIGRVLDNLLSNAIKYSEDEVTLTARPSDDASEIVVEVEDRGIGIPANEIGNLFDKFFRITSAGRKGRGAGLGLAICKAIVTAHGGRIGVRSAPREGSTFWFTLPVHAA